MDEIGAFLAVLLERKPEEPTACDGWLVRDLVAHLAAGAREEADLIEDALAGRPARATREFAEREAGHRAMEYPELLAALAAEGERLRAAVDALERAGGTARFTGATLDAAAFRTHGRSELALHRWDLAGDDEAGRRLLAQPELTAHAVRVLSAMGGLRESFRSRAARVSRGDLAFVLRSPGEPDVLVKVRPDTSVDVVPDAGGGHPVVGCAVHDRLLLLWGRAAERADLSGVPASLAGDVRRFLRVSGR